MAEEKIAISTTTQTQGSTPELKISFTNIESRRNSTQKPRGVLVISIFQKYHQGKYLQAILDAAKEIFGDIQIVVAGTLNKHNFMMEGFDEKEAYKKAKTAEDEWIAQHQFMVNSLSLISYKLTRWDEWLKHQDYDKKMQILDIEMKKKNGFRALVEKAALHALQAIQDNDEIPIEERMVYAKKYILEEIAFRLILNDQLGQNGHFYHCYPGESKVARLIDESIAKLPITLTEEWKIKLSSIQIREKKENGLVNGSYNTPGVGLMAAFQNNSLKDQKDTSLQALSSTEHEEDDSEEDPFNKGLKFIVRSPAALDPDKVKAIALYSATWKELKKTPPSSDEDEDPENVSKTRKVASGSPPRNGKKISIKK